MGLRIRNVVVVGKSALSTSILRTLSHASDDHYPKSNIRYGEADHSDYIKARPSYDSDHHHGPLYHLTLLIRPHQMPPSIDNIHYRTSDYEFSSLITAFQNTDVVISTVAPADISFQKHLIDAAIAAHVSHFIPCEFSYDTQKPSVRNAFPPCDARAEILAYLKKRCWQSQKLSWTALATGCLLDNALTDGLLAIDMTWKCATIYGSGNQTFPCSTLKMIGEAVVQLLKDLQEGRGRDEYLYRCEFVTSQNRILAAIEGIDGQSWDVIRADVDECVKEGKTRMEKGFLDGAMTLLARNVLYGEVDDMSHWCKPQLSGNEVVKLDQVIKVVMNQVEKNGKPDCGCG